MIKIGMDHEELTKQFQLTVITQASDLGKASAMSRRMISAWNYIDMAHIVSWPLHVVFTPFALEKYDSFFCMLLFYILIRTYIHKYYIMFISKSISFDV